MNHNWLGLEIFDVIVAVITLNLNDYFNLLCYCCSTQHSGLSKNWKIVQLIIMCVRVFGGPFLSKKNDDFTQHLIKLKQYKEVFLNCLPLFRILARYVHTGKTWNYRTICWRQAHPLNQGLVAMLFLHNISF